jgi:hypothetical protein
MKTWTEIRDAHDPDGTKHDLTFKCPCGQSMTCRCSKPKTVVEGLCDECAKQPGWTRKPVSESIAAIIGQRKPT